MLRSKKLKDDKLLKRGQKTEVKKRRRKEQKRN